VELQRENGILERLEDFERKGAGGRESLPVEQPPAAVVAVDPVRVRVGLQFGEKDADVSLPEREAADWMDPGLVPTIPSDNAVLVRGRRAGRSLVRRRSVNIEEDGSIRGQQLAAVRPPGADPDVPILGRSDQVDPGNGRVDECCFGVGQRESIRAGLRRESVSGDVVDRSGKGLAVRGSLDAKTRDPDLAADGNARHGPDQIGAGVRAEVAELQVELVQD
jgi:hypothetical protein